MSLAAVLGGLVLAAGAADPLPREPQLYVAGAEGGAPRQLTRGASSHENPSWSPDGARLAVVSRTADRAALRVVNADGSGRRTLVRRETGGPAAVAWAPNGTRIAFTSQRPSGTSFTTTVETVRPNGSGLRRLTRFSGRRIIEDDAGPVWSPDSTRIAYARATRRQAHGAEGTLQVIVARPDGSSRRPLVAGSGDQADPRWSPDGRWIAFTRTSSAKAPRRLVAIPAAGGTARNLPGDLLVVSATWSPDGRQLALAGARIGGDRRYHLYVVEVGGDELRALPGEVTPTRPAWSADGARIAFADRDGAVRTVAPDGSDQRTLTRLPGAEIRDLAWSPDGASLAFSARKRPAEG